MATPAPSRPAIAPGATPTSNAATAGLTPFSSSTSDARADRAFVAWFNALPPSPGGALRFFDRKDCYTLHGDDALLVARELVRTPGAVTRMEELPTLALSRATYEAVLRWALLEGGGGNGGRRVALFEPSTAATPTPGSSIRGGNCSWKKVKEASPGRLAAFEGDLFRNADAPEAPPLMAVAIGPPSSSGSSAAAAATAGGFVVGVAFVDAAARTLSACELGDDAAFGVLEAVAAAAGVREAVLRDDAGSVASSAGGSGGGGDESAAAAPSSSTPKSASAAAALAAFRRASAALERAGALVTPLSKSSFATKELEADLSRLLRSRSLELHRDVLDRPLAAQALAGALSAAEAASSDPEGLGKWSLSLHDARRSLRLDAAAAAALGVAWPPRAGADPASSALARLLNVCRTPMGKRLLPAWLKAPLVCARAIARRHDVVGALAGDAGLRLALRGSLLRGIPDVDRLARKLERGASGLPDLCSLYRVVSRLSSIEAALRAVSVVVEGGEGGDDESDGKRAVETVVEWFADPLRRAADADHLGKFEDLVEAAVELDRVPDEYLIRPEYDDGLAALRGDKDAAERGVERAAAEAAAALGLALGSTVKLEWMSSSSNSSADSAGRVRCLRVTATEERRIRSRLNGGGREGFALLETRKDGTKFTSAALARAAEALSRADAAVGKRQAALAAQVVGVAATFCDVWKRVGALLAELDALCALADVGASAPSPWVRPRMLPMAAARTAGAAGEAEAEAEAPANDNPSSSSSPCLLSLVDARHPVVESLDGVDFVPNSLELKKGESWFTIVTGPNMGGKSTFIRGAGVCVLLAQVGSFVPCASAVIPVRDAVFARVGAGDCQSRGVSTFMAEMLETAAILRGATSNSLVIVDELGRGTSTYDGLGLAAAIAEHLMGEVGCPTLFATHFHELTSLKGPGGVANLHVETAADASSGGRAGAARTGRGLTMLHRVAPGPCDESFGLACARAARLPDEVIEAAAAKAAELEAAGVGKKRRMGGGGEAGGKEDADADAAVVARAKRFLADFAALSSGGDSEEDEVRARAQALVEGLRAEGGAAAAALRGLLA